MYKSLNKLSGISEELVKKFNELGIKDLIDLRKNTRTQIQRDRILNKINPRREQFLTSMLAFYSIQAELLSIDRMSPDVAVELIEGGVYDVESFLELGRRNISRILKLTRGMNVDKFIENIKKNNDKLFEIPKELNPRTREIFISDIKRIVSGRVEVPKDLLEDSEADVEDVTDYLDDLSTIISNLGIGIAEAQRNLDLAAIDIQNEILENEELAAMGLTANWYSIPEVDFELKMEYNFTKKESYTANYDDNSKKNINKNKFRMRIMPSNATYNNYFNTVQKQKSTLKLKFVPVPPEQKYTNRIIIPNFVGLSAIDAMALLDELDIENYKLIDKFQVEITPEENMVVKMQSIEQGKVLLIGNVLKLTLGLPSN